MATRSERLDRLVDDLSTRLGSTGYTDDTWSSLSVDLGFIARDAGALAARIRRLSVSKTDSAILNHAERLKEALEHVMYHTETALPRLAVLIELLEAKDSGGSELGDADLPL